MDEPSHESTQRWTALSNPTPEHDPQDGSAPRDDLDRALRELIEHERGDGSSLGMMSPVVCLRA
jgi:hypothetical protein